MYNAYIPGCQPYEYEKAPDEPGPKKKASPGPSRQEAGGIAGALAKLGLGKLDSGDLILLLLLFLLLREGDKFDPVLLLALASVFLLPEGGAAVEDGPVG